MFTGPAGRDGAVAVIEHATRRIRILGAAANRHLPQAQPAPPALRRAPPDRIARAAPRRDRRPQWADNDLQPGVLLITHTTQRTAGHLMQCLPNTSTSRRAVILDRTTVRELRCHYARQQTDAARLQIDPSGFVSTNRRGQPLNPDRLYREFLRATKDVGLPRSACTIYGTAPPASPGKPAPH